MAFADIWLVVYNMRRYKPRSSVIDNLRKEVKDKAVKDAEDLLSF